MPGPTKEQLTAEFAAVATKLAEFLTEEQVTNHIAEMVERIGQNMSDEDFDKWLDTQPLAEEINAFGWGGPCGMGLGRYGGHAVGNDGD